MKIVFAICIMIFLFSCKRKESEHLEPKNYSQFTGNWVYYNEKCSDTITNHFQQCHSMEIDKNDIVWVGSNSCLSTFINGYKHVITEYNFDDTLFNGVSYFSQVLSMYQSKEGSFYIGTNTGLYNYTDNWNKLINDRLIYAFYEDNQSNLWIGTDNGLFKKTNNQIVEINLENITFKYIRSIVVEDNGKIWALSGNLIYRFDGCGWSKIDSLMGIPAENFTYFYKDSQNNLWFLSYAYGIIKSDGINWTKFDFYIKDFMGVKRCVEDSKGRMWFARENGVLKLESSTWETSVIDNVFVVNGFASGTINSLRVDSKGDIWCSTYDKGVYKLIVN